MKKLMCVMTMLAAVISIGCSSKGKSGKTEEIQKTSVEKKIPDSLTVLDGDFNEAKLGVKYYSSARYGEGLMLTYKEYGFLATQETLPLFKAAAEKYKEWSAQAKEKEMTNVSKKIMIGDEDCITSDFYYQGNWAGIAESRFFFHVDENGKCCVLIGSCVGDQIDAATRNNTDAYIFYALDDSCVDDFISLVSPENFAAVKAQQQNKQQQADSLM